MDTINETEIENLSIKASRVNKTEKDLIIALSGAIDTYNSQEFENILNSLIQQGYLNITFSCSKLNYISSMGIGVFMKLLLKLQENNGKIVFTEVQDSVYRIFNGLGFATFFVFNKT